MTLVRAERRLASSLYLRPGSGSENLALFHRLAANKERLEQHFDQPLHWIERIGGDGCRIAAISSKVD